MSDWLKRVIEVVVVLLAILGEVYLAVTRPIEHEIDDLKAEIHAKK